VQSFDVRAWPFSACSLPVEEQPPSFVAVCGVCLIPVARVAVVCLSPWCPRVLGRTVLPRLGRRPALDSTRRQLSAARSRAARASPVASRMEEQKHAWQHHHMPPVPAPMMIAAASPAGASLAPAASSDSKRKRGQRNSRHEAAARTEETREEHRGGGHHLQADAAPRPAQAAFYTHSGYHLGNVDISPTHGSIGAAASAGPSGEDYATAGGTATDSDTSSATSSGVSSHFGSAGTSSSTSTSTTPNSQGRRSVLRTPQATDSPLQRIIKRVCLATPSLMGHSLKERQMLQQHQAAHAAIANDGGMMVDTLDGPLELPVPQRPRSPSAAIPTAAPVDLAHRTFVKVVHRGGSAINSPESNASDMLMSPPQAASHQMLSASVPHTTVQSPEQSQLFAVPPAAQPCDAFSFPQSMHPPPHHPHHQQQSSAFAACAAYESIQMHSPNFPAGQQGLMFPAAFFAHQTHPMTSTNSVNATYMVRSQSQQSHQQQQRRAVQIVSSSERQRERGLVCPVLSSDASFSSTTVSATLFSPTHSSLTPTSFKAHQTQQQQQQSHSIKRPNTIGTPASMAPRSMRGGKVSEENKHKRVKDADGGGAGATDSGGEAGEAMSQDSQPYVFLSPDNSSSSFSSPSSVPSAPSSSASSSHAHLPSHHGTWTHQQRVLARQQMQQQRLQQQQYQLMQVQGFSLHHTQPLPSSGKEHAVVPHNSPAITAQAAPSSLSSTASAHHPVSRIATSATAKALESLAKSMRGVQIDAKAAAAENGQHGSTGGSQDRRRSMEYSAGVASQLSASSSPFTSSMSDGSSQIPRSNSARNLPSISGRLSTASASEVSGQKQQHRRLRSANEENGSGGGGESGMQRSPVTDSPRDYLSSFGTSDSRFPPRSFSAASTPDAFEGERMTDRPSPNGSFVPQVPPTPRRSLHDIRDPESASRSACSRAAATSASMDGPDDLFSRPRRDLNQMDVQLDEMGGAIEMMHQGQQDPYTSDIDSGTDDELPTPTPHHVSLKPALLVALSTPNLTPMHANQGAMSPITSSSSNGGGSHSEIPVTGLFEAFVKLTKLHSPNPGSSPSRGGSTAGSTPSHTLQLPPTGHSMGIPCAVPQTAGLTFSHGKASEIASSLVGSAPAALHSAVSNWPHHA
jgi:hypothetical protein